MKKSFCELIIGSVEEKKEYRTLMKKVNALPKNYKYAYKKIQNYMYCVGSPNGDFAIFSNLEVFYELLNLFQESVAEEKTLVEFLGEDVAKFADEFMLAFSDEDKNSNARNKLNHEIKEYLERGCGLNE
ncbi:MAG: DUF1048 domain-containing protein [Lachnospiraceae bacterium]